MSEMKTYLVTGAAGFVAGHLCEALLIQGNRVVAYDNFDPYYDPKLKKSNIALLNKVGGSLFQFHELDLTQESMKVESVDGVFHLAAKAGVRPSMKQPADYFLHNVEATRRVLQWVEASPSKPPLIFASSSSVYGSCETLPFQESDAQGKTLNPYAASKWIAERMIESYTKASGLRALSLRYFTVYGPRQRPEMAISHFIRSIHQKTPIEVFGEGRLIRDFTFVTDIVDGTLRSLDWLKRQPSKTYDCFNLGAQSPITVSELIHLIERVLGVVAIQKPMPRPPEDMSQTAAQCSRAFEQFGFAPRIPLEEGIRKSAEWILK